MRVFGGTLRNIESCDTTSFFYKAGKIGPLKKLSKKSSCLALIKCFGRNKSFADCMIFIQTVIYYRNISES